MQERKSLDILGVVSILTQYKMSQNRHKQDVFQLLLKIFFSSHVKSTFTQYVM